MVKKRVTSCYEAQIREILPNSLCLFPGAKFNLTRLSSITRKKAGGVGSGYFLSRRLWVRFPPCMCMQVAQWKSVGKHRSRLFPGADFNRARLSPITRKRSRWCRARLLRMPRPSYGLESRRSARSDHPVAERRIIRDHLFPGCSQQRNVRAEPRKEPVA